MLSKIYTKLCLEGLSSDKGTSHSYIDFYEGLFMQYRHSYINFLEIGIQYGYSCALWREYFTNARIYGMDIEKIQTYKYGYKFIHGSSIDADLCDKNFKHEPLNIIIDDGDHSPESQCKTFDLYWNYMESSGLYVIEDVYDIDNNISEFEKVFKKYDVKYDIFDYRDITDRVDDTLIVIRK